MWKYRLENPGGFAALFVNLSRRESVAWRRVAVDAVIVVLFVLTSSWFMRW